MKIGIVLGTKEPEKAWNAFRFGVTALKAHHVVTVFLINEGVEIEEIEKKIEHMDRSLFEPESM